MDKRAIYNKVLGCLVGGIIGDAMGAPVEGWRYERIVKEKGYIDDIAFARNYISHKTRINNYGKRRIVVDLLQKGVKKEDIQAAYHQAAEEGDAESEFDAAARALAKRLARKDFAAIKKDPKEMQKLMAFLVRRGFSYDVVKEVLKNYEN